jgi:hypothetical protein
MGNSFLAATANLYSSSIFRGIKAFDKRVHTRQREPVEYLQSTLLVFKYACRLQHSQMAGDSGPARANHVHKLANATFAIGQRLDDLQPRWMAEGLEDSGALFALFGGNFVHVADNCFAISRNSNPGFNPPATNRWSLARQRCLIPQSATTLELFK